MIYLPHGAAVMKAKYIQYTVIFYLSLRKLRSKTRIYKQEDITDQHGQNYIRPYKGVPNAEQILYTIAGAALEGCSKLAIPPKIL